MKIIFYNKFENKFLKNVEKRKNEKSKEYNFLQIFYLQILAVFSSIISGWYLFIRFWWILYILIKRRRKRKNELIQEKLKRRKRNLKKEKSKKRIQTFLFIS